MKAEIDLKELDRWYTQHFEELVEKYAGKAVAIVNGQVVEVGVNEREVDRNARERHPEATPFVITVPTEEELICLLFGSGQRSDPMQVLSAFASLRGTSERLFDQYPRPSALICG